MANQFTHLLFTFSSEMPISALMQNKANAFQILVTFLQPENERGLIF